MTDEALKCRATPAAPEDGKGFCGMPAGIGLLTEFFPEGQVPDPILELTPLCADHAPEYIHEVSTRVASIEWSLVSLAYGASGGDLR